MATPKLTVMLATHDGQATLRQVLDGYVAQQAGDYDWRLIVIDNASGEDVRDLLAAYRDRLPLTVLHEPQPGKNRALNLGLSELKPAEIDLFIFTDDDAVPEPDFLRQWARICVEAPAFGMFGGTVEPLFQAEPPAWLKHLEAEFPALYAVNRRADGPIEAAAIFGPNMAVRGAVMAEHRFNEEIGPASDQPDYAMGSETEFLIRVEAKAGVRSHFHAAAKVRHIIRAHQLTHDFVARRAFRHGRGVAQQRHLATGRIQPFAPFDAFKARLAFVMLYSPIERSRVTYRWRIHWARGYQSYVCCAGGDAKCRLARRSAGLRPERAVQPT